MPVYNCQPTEVVCDQPEPFTLADPARDLKFNSCDRHYGRKKLASAFFYLLLEGRLTAEARAVFQYCTAQSLLDGARAYAHHLCDLNAHSACHLLRLLIELGDAKRQLLNDWREAFDTGPFWDTMRRSLTHPH